MNIFIKKNPFKEIQKGLKTTEGRLYIGIFKKLKTNDIIIFKFENNDIKCKITKIIVYDNFNDYLLNEGIYNTVPRAKSFDEALNIYRNIYKKKIKDNKVVAIRFNKI